MQEKVITDTKIEGELLPCPFCGGKVKLYKHLAQKGWGLSCSECYAMFFWEGTFDRYGNSKENIELLSKDRFNRRA